MTLLLELRDAARIEPSEARRRSLNLVANDLHLAIRAFAEEPTHDNLRTVNGLWARGMRLLDFTTRQGGGGSGGALKEGARLAA